jgi:membrane protease YdiL (CAAX protease family)
MWTEPSRASTMRSEHDVVNAIVAFVATAYALSIALSLIVALTGGYGGPLIGLRYLSMFLPAIAVLVAASATHEKPRVRSDFLPLRYVPVALFLVPFVMHAVMVPAMAVTGGLQWQDWLTPQSDGLYYTPASRGWGTLTLQGLAGRIVLNAIGGLAVASFLSFFEEIGWRAWLLPRLHDRMGPRSAVVLTAIIWALWHVPFQLSGTQHIDGVSPVKLALTFPFGIMIVGLIFGWLWLRTENVWIVSVAHGSLNSWSQYAFKYMKDAPATDSDLLALAAGGLALLFVGSVLLWRLPGSPSGTLASGA